MAATWTPPAHPNFPDRLNINPSRPPLPFDAPGNVLSEEAGSAFDSDSQRAAIGQYGIAGRVWEAAYLLIQYFDPPSLGVHMEFDPPCSLITTETDVTSQKPLTIVELGSGTGYVGIKLVEKLRKIGQRGDLVVVTDLPDVCPLLEDNLRLERQRWLLEDDRSGAVESWVKALPWGSLEYANRLAHDLQLHTATSGQATLGFPRHPTHIICSDLVYFPHLLAPLLRSLLHITSPPFTRDEPPVQVLMAYEIRSLTKETPFWSAFGLWFSFKPLLVRYAHPLTHPEEDNIAASASAWQRFGARKDADGHAFVFVAQRKAQSHTWVVPDDDGDLLAGVGAQGTQTTKIDDTFEMLLLLKMDDDDMIC